MIKSYIVMTDNNSTKHLKRNPPSEAMKSFKPFLEFTVSGIVGQKGEITSVMVHDKKLVASIFGNSSSKDGNLV